MIAKGKGAKSFKSFLFFSFFEILEKEKFGAQFYTLDFRVQRTISDEMFCYYLVYDS